MRMGIQSQPLAPLAFILLKRLHYKCFSSFRQVKKVVYLKQIVRSGDKYVVSLCVI